MYESRGEIHYIKYMDACTNFAKHIIHLFKSNINHNDIEPEEKANFRNCLVLGILLNFSEEEIVSQIRNIIRESQLSRNKFIDWQKKNYNALEENKKMNFDKISQDNTSKMVEIYTNLKNYIATIDSGSDIVFSELPPFTDNFDETYYAKEKCQYLSYILSTIIPASELKTYSPKILQRKRKGTLYSNIETYSPFIEKNDVIEFYKKALKEVLDLLVNYRVDGTLNIKNESGEMDITETLTFKKWLKMAQVFGIDGNVLISNELNPKQILEFKNLDYALNCDERFRLYHKLCYDSAETEIDNTEGKNDIREIALYYGIVSDIFPEATAEHIEEYKDAIWTKRFLDSFDEIMNENKDYRKYTPKPLFINENIVIDSTTYCYLCRKKYARGETLKIVSTKEREYLIYVCQSCYDEIHFGKVIIRSMNEWKPKAVIKSLSNDLRSWIVELRKRYQIDGISFNDSGKKARTRLSYAVESYAKEAESENIIFACDTIFMNDRDSGFLITDKHIYIYELEKNIKHRIAINDIYHIKIPKRKKCDLNFFTNKNDCIRVKNVSTDNDTTKQILSLVNEALEHLKEINNAEK